MLTVAAVLARTLRDAGVTRMFGLPGGEILDFIEAARRVGIEFLLTRHEAAAVDCGGLDTAMRVIRRDA